MNDREKKKERQKIEKSKYLKNKNNFLDEIKSIFHNYIRAIIWWKKKKCKIEDTSFEIEIENDKNDNT